MDSQKRTLIGGTPNPTIVARPSASPDYQRDQNIPCLSKDGRHVVLGNSSMELKRVLSLASRLGQMPLSSPEGDTIAPVEHGSEAYTPLQRWEHENFREQPWHGIARELMVDEWSRDYISSSQEIAEAAVTNLFISDCGRETEEWRSQEQDDKKTTGTF